MLASEKAPEVAEKRFDTRTHVRDPKSGRVIAHNFYSLKIIKGTLGEGIRLFERPQKSGLFYYANGELAEEHSQDGLARQAKELADRSKTDFERKSEALAKAKLEFESSRKVYEAEEAAKARAAKEAHFKKEEK